MFYDKFNRRMFLVGSGKTLMAIPFLSSLMPEGANAQTGRPIRFILCTNHQAPNPRTFFGKTNKKSTELGALLASGNILASSVPYLPLSMIDGDISYLLSPFTPYKSKMALIRGIDILASENGPHPRGYSSAATGHSLIGGPYNASGQASIDAVIASKYKGPTGQRHMILGISYSGSIGSAATYNFVTKESSTFDLNPGFELDPQKRVIAKDRIVLTSKVIERFFPVIEQKETGFKRRDLLNLIYGDYSSLKGKRKISKDDKNKLDHYMTLLTELSNTQDISPSAIPTLENDFPPPVLTKNAGESDSEFKSRRRAALVDWEANQKAKGSEAMFRNQIKLMTAAFASDLVRVASFHWGGIGSHDYHHTGSWNDTEISNERAKAYYTSHLNQAKRVEKIVAGLNAFKEDGETLLDNSLLLWNQSYGTADRGHSKKDFPIVMLGGAGGKLRMGNYYDYRVFEGKVSKGVPMNNLYVTLMSCYGVTPSDYEYVSGSGYGSYDFKTYSQQFYTLEGKRAHLPYFSKAA